MERLDRRLVDELSRVAREAVRDELTEQARRRSRRAALYTAAGVVALYTGAALALTVGLALAVALPGWAAALITAAILGIVAFTLYSAARSRTPPPSAARAAREAEPDVRHRGHVAEVADHATPTGGLGPPHPPKPPKPPMPPGVRPPEPGQLPDAGTTDPESPHHRA